MQSIDFDTRAVFIGGIVWTGLATQPAWLGWLLTVGSAAAMARLLLTRR